MATRLLAGIVPTATVDTLAPTLRVFSLSASRIDTAGHPSSVRVRIAADDDLSGFANPDIAHASVTLRHTAGWPVLTNPSLNRVAGTALSSEFEADVPIAQHSIPGVYRARIVLRDDAGNAREWLSGDLDALGFSSALELTDDPPPPDPPTVDPPVSDQGFCTDRPAATVTLRGRTEPGLGVRFRESGELIGEVSASSQDGQFEFTGSFVPGAHQVGISAYDPAKPTAESSSTPVGFNVASSQGAIRRPVPGRRAISPLNHDAIADATTVTVHSGLAGNLRIEVLRRGQVVRRSPVFSAWPSQSIEWKWDGRDGRRRFVPSGRYSVRATWTAGACRSQMAEDIVVDNNAPTVRDRSLGTTVFYPREDDAFVEYRDTITARYRGLDEVATSSLLVYAGSSSRPLRTLDLGRRNPGVGAITWNGRTRAGALLPQGFYEVAFRFTDRLGNSRTTKRMRLLLSYQHVVKRQGRIEKFGDEFVGGAINGGGGASLELSYFDRGLWLYTQDFNFDDENPDLAGAKYKFGIEVTPV